MLTRIGKVRRGSGVAAVVCRRVGGTLGARSLPMTWLRTAWLLLVGVPVTAFYASWAVLASWAGYRYAPNNVYDRIMRNWSRLLLRANGVTVTAEGLERLDPTQPYVFVANHTSIVDIWALLVAIPHSFRYVAKKELERVPVFGRAMMSAGNIFIDRGNLAASFSSYDEAARPDPQGTLRHGVRRRDTQPGRPAAAVQEGSLHPGHPGGRAAGAALHRRGPRAHTEGGAQRPPGAVVVRVGEPIDSRGLTYDDRGRLSDEARAAMVRLAAR